MSHDVIISGAGPVGLFLACELALAKCSVLILESILARRAEALDVEIKRGLAITGFHQTAAEVTVQSGDQSFKGKWLVGCDGSRSVVRKVGGFEFAGTEPEFTGYSTMAPRIWQEGCGAFSRTTISVATTLWQAIAFLTLSSKTVQSLAD